MYETSCFGLEKGGNFVPVPPTSQLAREQKDIDES